MTAPRGVCGAKSALVLAETQRMEGRDLDLDLWLCGLRKDGERGETCRCVWEVIVDQMK